MAEEKNAISILNEMAQQGVISSVAIRENGRKGLAHMPVFTFLAEVVRRGKKYTASAEAANKKAAKEAAARAVLKKLGIAVGGEPMAKNKEYDAAETAKSYLNRWHQQHKVPAPVYEVVDQWGDDHDPTYKVVVRFLGKTASGTAHRIKEAEEMAAREMLDLLP